jgi:hypothetical protein
VTDGAHVDVGLGACKFFFCHFSILQRTFPVIRFYVCTMLLDRPTREQGGTPSQTA